MTVIDAGRHLAAIRQLTFAECSWFLIRPNTASLTLRLRRDDGAWYS